MFAVSAVGTVMVFSVFGFSVSAIGSMFVFRVSAAGSMFVFRVSAAGSMLVFSVFVFGVSAAGSVMMVVFAFDLPLMEIGSIAPDARRGVCRFGKGDDSRFLKHDDGQCRCDDCQNDGYDDLKCVFSCHFEYSLCYN